MDHQLETERLLLQQLSAKDRDHFFRLLKDDEVIRFCFDLLSDIEIQESFESRIKAWNTQSTYWLCFAMSERESGMFVGVNGFQINANNDAEVGFLLFPQFQGLGYATESLRTIINYAYDLGIYSMMANVTEGNVASSNVLKKCGFSQVKLEPNSVSIGAKKYGNIVYALATN